MVSIGVHGGPTPHDALHDALDWGRVVVATLARGVVATLLGLALWAAAPALIGWQPTTVMTGSMEPRLAPGDVVVSRPVAPSDLRVGKILLADDPDRPGHLRMHRYVEDGPDRTIITKGDANPQQDSTPLERSAVHGVAFLRVPVVGTPVLWARTGEWARVGMFALAVVALLALCTVDGSLRRYAAGAHERDRHGPDGPTDAADAGGDGQEALLAAAPLLPSGAPPDRRGRHAHGRHALVTGATSADRERHGVDPLRARGLHRADPRPRARRLVAGVLAVLVAAGVGVLEPSAAVAGPFGAKTATAVAFAAVAVPEPTALSCTANADGSVSIGFSATSASALPTTSFSVMNGSTVLQNGSSSPIRVAGSSLLALGQTYTVTVRANTGSTWSSTSTATTKIQTALVGTTLTCG